jgi:ribonuclease Z
MGYFARGFEIHVSELNDDDLLDFEEYTVGAMNVEHGVPGLGYVFEEKPRRGRFNLDRAKELGIPEGPLYRRLQAGETVEVEGKEFTPEMVLGPPRRGRKVVISGDTTPCRRIIQAATGADVLVHESTYASDMADKAEEYGHSTAEGAANIAKEAGVDSLYLTHISSRYEDISLLEKEAQVIFPSTVVAKDLMSVEVRSKE